MEIKNNWNEGHLLLGSAEINSVSEENEKLNKQLKRNRIMSCLETEAWSVSI